MKENDQEEEVYQLRWKGRPSGPFTREVIEKKLHTGELSLLHEILFNERWTTLKRFLQATAIVVPPPPPPPAPEPTEAEMGVHVSNMAAQNSLQIKWTNPQATQGNIASLKQSAVCSQCNAQVANHAQFCANCGHRLLSDADVSALAQGHLAGFWLRAAAALLDGLIVTVASILLWLLLALLITGIMALVQSGAGFSVGTLGMVSAGTMVSGVGYWLAWIYFATLESSTAQATFGKQLLGLVVVDLHGQRVSFWRASARYFGKLVSSAILFAGWIMAGFTEKKQTLHDMMAGCLVLKK